jgi:hypothetical protein
VCSGCPLVARERHACLGTVVLKQAKCDRCRLGLSVNRAGSNMKPAKRLLQLPWKFGWKQRSHDVLDAWKESGKSHEEWNLQGRDMENTQWDLKTGSLYVKSTSDQDVCCSRGVTFHLLKLTEHVVILTMVSLWIIMKASAHETHNYTQTFQSYMKQNAEKK